jgi:hypothetical protein
VIAEDSVTMKESSGGVLQSVLQPRPFFKISSPSVLSARL